MEVFIILVVLLVVLWLIFRKRRNDKDIVLEEFPDAWRKVLQKTVRFYNELTKEERALFEKRLYIFLKTTKITGVNAKVDDKVRVLVGASAIIPVFSFSNWQYINLDEVLIYPSGFNDNFEFGKSDSNILGMVGTNYMEGKMILSKPALIKGFSNDQDKKNVGIHEFVHLIDKTDGVIDGIPSALTGKEFSLPWLNHIRLKMEEIHNQNSDINPYGGVRKEEFFSVISEYFFERPKLLQVKHPEMYKLLNEIFTIDLADKYTGLNKSKIPGRNDPCICGSGKKYKNCCWNKENKSF